METKNKLLGDRKRQLERVEDRRQKGNENIVTIVSFCFFFFFSLVPFRVSELPRNNAFEMKR